MKKRKYEVIRSQGTIPKAKASHFNVHFHTDIWTLQ